MTVPMNSTDFTEIELNTIDSIQSKLSLFIIETGKVLFEREELTRIIALALFAKEHVFMYGPPGTAKSGIANAFQKFVEIDNKEYFRYLMTDFTSFHEIFGEELKHDEHSVSRRKVEGKLPTAYLAFIDEIFKGNAEILNAYLTILNERTFDNGYEGTIECPLNTVLAASNEFPRTSYLRALYERFLFRIPVLNVEDFDNRMKLLNGEFEELGEISKFKKSELKFINKHYKRVKIPYEIGGIITQIIDALEVMHNISAEQEELAYQVSSRTHVKLGKVVRLCAYLNKRDRVDESDLLLLRYILWDNMKQRERTNPKINELIFKTGSYFAGAISKEITIFSQVFERYFSNFEAVIMGRAFIGTDKEFMSYILNLKAYVKHIEGMEDNLLYIKEELEHSVKIEELACKNIFIHEESVLTWRVSEFEMEIIDKNWHIVNKYNTDENLVIPIEGEQNKYKAYGILLNALRINSLINMRITKWLNENDAFFSYKIAHQNNQKMVR